jgi:polyphosphate kinase
MPIVRTLLENFDLQENAVYRINGPVNLNRVIQVYDLVQRPELKFPPFQPRVLAGLENMFDMVSERDVLLHHPFDSFAPVLELIKQAAEDPNVLAIKQTLYRTGKDSPIVDISCRPRATARTSPCGRAARALRRGSQPRPRPTACRMPACRSCTAWSATRPTPRCC